MKTKQLGNTGLEISSLALGTMTFGDGADEASCRAIYTKARDAGITIFDCANVYADGLSETILGSLVKHHRDDVILTTKAYYQMPSAPEERGLGRAALTTSFEKSLKRLDTDYLDIFFLHAFDPLVPLEETLDALNAFVISGKVRHVGLSNFAAWQVMKAQCIASNSSNFKISVIQPMYNLFKRQAETELLPMAVSEGMGALIYSPLAGGLLTGKYRACQMERGRFDKSAMYRDRYTEAQTPKKVDRFLSIANAHGIDPIHLAIAWTANHPAVSAPLIGARTLVQLTHALGTIDLSLPPRLLMELDDVFPPPPLATDRSDEQVTSTSSSEK